MMSKYVKIKQELDVLVDVVSSYYSISTNDVFESNREDCVNARYITIYIMCEKHTDAEIAYVSQLSKSVVNKIRNNFRQKESNYSFKEDFNAIILALSKK